MRVLVIEDDPDILANITHHLTRRGYIVDCAEDGLRGYAMAAEGGFDLIVLDLMLPRLDGYDLCRRLRTEAGCDTPVIMVTARDTLDNRLTGFDAGADDYLVKPFALAELAARAKALLHRASGAGAARVLRVGAAAAAVAAATADAADARQSRGGAPRPARRGAVARFAAGQRQPAHPYPPDPPGGRQAVRHAVAAHRAWHRLPVAGR